MLTAPPPKDQTLGNIRERGVKDSAKVLGIPHGWQGDWGMEKRRKHYFFLAYEIKSVDEEMICSGGESKLYILCERFCLEKG